MHLNLTTLNAHQWVQSITMNRELSDELHKDLAAVYHPSYLLLTLDLQASPVLRLLILKEFKLPRFQPHNVNSLIFLCIIILDGGPRTNMAPRQIPQQVVGGGPIRARMDPNRPAPGSQQYYTNQPGQSRVVQRKPPVILRQKRQ